MNTYLLVHFLNLRIELFCDSFIHEMTMYVRTAMHACKSENDLAPLE